MNIQLPVDQPSNREGTVEQYSHVITDEFQSQLSCALHFKINVDILLHNSFL